MTFIYQEGFIKFHMLLWTSISIFERSKCLSIKLRYLWWLCSCKMLQVGELERHSARRTGKNQANNTIHWAIGLVFCFKHLGVRCAPFSSPLKGVLLLVLHD